MELNIDIEKLTDSPYKEALKKGFLFEDDELLSSLILELRNARPSTFLVSGYRGVGKTSFINRVSQELKTDFICATLNLAKYGGYPNLVKKIIRQLFISYELAISSGDLKDLSLQTEFRLLYDRTFHDIVNSKITNAKTEFKHVTTADFDLKKFLLPLSLLLLSLLNISENLISINGLNWIIAGGTAIWAAITALKWTFSKSNQSTETEELSSKSLYDDEIAEYHLMDILAKLNEKEIRVVISLDELDKIEDASVAITIMDDIKPLLLSGMANFFIVAGQHLYYEYEKSMSKDNQVISTLFSRSIHIPFLRHSTLKAFCLNLLSDENLIKNPLVNSYLDSIIISSSRIPRKLVNEIRSKLIWKNKVPFLNINIEKKEFYEYESRLLACITDIIDNDLPSITSNSIQIDFFTSQIYLWLAKMRKNFGMNISMEEIIDQEKYDHVPSAYGAQLYPLAELLTDKLLEHKFIRWKQNEDEEDPMEGKFVWRPRLITPENTIAPKIHEDLSLDSDDVQENTSHPFISQFAHLEALTRKIYNEVMPEPPNQPNQSLKHLINQLVRKQILTVAWLESSKLDNIIDVRNKIVHGTISEEEGLRELKGAEFNLSRLKSEIIERYIFYVCRKSVDGFKFEIDNKGGFDFVAYHPSKTLSFDVKYIQSSTPSISELKRMFEKFLTFKEITKQECRYFLILFKVSASSDYSYYNKVNRVLEVEYPYLKPFIEVVLLLEDGTSGIANSLKKIFSDMQGIVSDQEKKPLAFHTNDERQDIEINIKEASLKSWPDDFEMQLNYEDGQRMALGEIQLLSPRDLGDEQFNIIVKKAKTDWPKDYSMQLYVFKEESEAIHKIRKLQADPLTELEFNDIYARAMQKYPGDYVMILHEFENEKQSLILLKDYQPAGISMEIFKKIREQTENEWPGDYQMQWSRLQEQIASYKKLNHG